MSRRARGTINPTDNIVGARLRHFRNTARLTQEDLARSARLTAKFVSQIENGHVNPSIGVITRLVVDGLNMPLAAFFASDSADDVRDDLHRLSALLSGQPAHVRQRALAVIKALVEEDAAQRPRPRK
jgi:transcriptional regulator with XRE-family HTH domain